MGLYRLPPAEGVRHGTVVQKAALVHGEGHVPEVGRDLQIRPVKVIEGGKVRDPIHVQKRDPIAVLLVVLEAGQVLEIVDGDKGDLPGGKGPGEFSSPDSEVR